MRHAVLIVLIVALFSKCSPLNILMYTAVIGPSHISFLDHISKILIERGHNVDVLFAHYNDRTVLNLTAGIRRKHTYVFDTPDMWYSIMSHLDNIFSPPTRIFFDMRGFVNMGAELCRVALRDDRVLNFVKSGKYDIGVTTDYDPCPLIMFEAAGVPSVATLMPTPLFPGHLIGAGLPAPTSIYGTAFTPKHDGSLFDKTFYFLKSAYVNYIDTPDKFKKFNEIARSKFGPGFADVADLERNIDVIFVNANEIVEKPRPISHKIKYIGGIGMKAAKSLTSPIKALLDKPSNGTIIFSFGTQAPTAKIPLEIRRNFVEAFKKFPDFTFIWKYDRMDDDDGIFEGATNVHRVPWIPQTDVLQDGRVKVFISHMGMNSFLETASAGVPVLAIPLFVDQTHNALNAEARQMGILLERHKLTAGNIENALKKLLNDEKYWRNAQRIARMMKENPNQPKETFVRWMEFAATHRGLHQSFNLPGAHLDPFFYYSGDVIILLISIFVIFSYILYRLLRTIGSVIWIERKVKTQ
ncbi:unnamed protein product [Caenorhabditis bovis]|uniref:glucuronosyltransferase n=1 Tax=Caenorhabditis bovis TaxID=2654633 RepID=A0A8S1ERP2_9PELO|nr:unnamed protein product [Caenorhabditis bovis]